MKSRTTPSFKKRYRLLPPDIQALALAAYKLWLRNPDLPGLRFKRVGDDVSVRIDRNYRALGILQGDTVNWYWIGLHDEYLRLIK